MKQHDRVDRWRARGLYPLNLTMNVRFVASSAALMSPAGGPGTNCYIEILSEAGTPGWRDFSAEIAREWMKLPGARPHWGKQFEHVPGMIEHIREAYGERLRRFLDVRARTGVDPARMFSNRLMDAIFFAPELDLADGE